MTPLKHILCILISLVYYSRVSSHCLWVGLFPLSKEQWATSAFIKKRLKPKFSIMKKEQYIWGLWSSPSGDIAATLSTQVTRWIQHLVQGTQLFHFILLSFFLYNPVNNFISLLLANMILLKLLIKRCDWSKYKVIMSLLNMEKKTYWYLAFL